MDELTEHQRNLLDFEAGTFGLDGAKERAIRETFGLGATTYYQQLNAMLDTQAALAHNPVPVTPLLRQRAIHQRSRSARSPRDDTRNVDPR